MSSGKTIELIEQGGREVDLSNEDAEFMAGLKFLVIPLGQGAEGRGLFMVNPKQCVGHFRLPSEAVVKIIPKIPSANVLKMLAYAFVLWNEQTLRPEMVEYE